MGNEVLLFVPNLIGYVRILLATASFVLFDKPVWFVFFYTTSITLDGFDGYFARTLKQTSRFGAVFDVVIDLFSRGFVWCALFRYGYLIIFVEWLAFLATQSRGESWKIPEESFPVLITKVMEKGFKTPLGFYVIGSLHLLPLWMYAYKNHFLTEFFGLPMWSQYIGIIFFVIGRTICFMVEMFYIKEYVILLLDEKSQNEKCNQKMEKSTE